MRKLLLALALSLTALSAHAEGISHGTLVIENPTIRATPPAAKVGGGFLTITNNGAEDDRLLSVSATFSRMGEIHEMKMENDVMKMAALPDGLVIPAGGSVELKPGGYHLMFMQLQERMMEGEVRKVSLTFEKAGVIELDFSVKSIADTMKMN